jgi:hypothetical protein
VLLFFFTTVVVLAMIATVFVFKLDLASTSAL